jgi:3-oxoadipate enol-lactonase
MAIRRWPGPVGAPTVLLLHGWTATSDLNWFPSYDALAERYQLIAFDHRGHGTGLRSRRPFRLADCADDAEVLLDALGIDKAIIVGYSMGGAVAQLVWQRHRDRVAGLVLCSTASSFSNSFNEQLQFLGLTGLAALSRLTPEVMRTRLAEQFLTKRSEQGWQQWAVDELKGHDWVKLLEAGQAIGNFSSAEWIGDVDVPTSLVITEGDQTVRTWRQKELAAKLDHAVAFTLPGNHNVCVTGADRFVPILRDAIDHVALRIAAPDALPATVTTLVEQLTQIRGVKAVGLGGSRAVAGTATSDWDLGVYVNSRFNVDALAPMVGEVHPPGSWGRLMNGGAWIDRGGLRIDVLLRDIATVTHWTDEARVGRFEIDGLPGYSAGVPTYVLPAEVARNRWLHGSIDAHDVPSALQNNGPAIWRWRRDFSMKYAMKHAERGDTAAMLSQATRACLEEAHARALERRVWVINERDLLTMTGLDSVNDRFRRLDTDPTASRQWLTDLRSLLAADLPNRRELSSTSDD